MDFFRAQIESLFQTGADGVMLFVDAPAKRAYVLPDAETAARLKTILRWSQNLSGGLAGVVTGAVMLIWGLPFQWPGRAWAVMALTIPAVALVLFVQRRRVRRLVADLPTRPHAASTTNMTLDQLAATGRGHLWMQLIAGPTMAAGFGWLAYQAATTGERTMFLVLAVLGIGNIVLGALGLRRRRSAGRSGRS